MEDIQKMKTLLAAGKFCKKREKELEAKRLQAELQEYSSNIQASNLLLRHFVTMQELRRTGLLLTLKEAEEKATEISEKMLDCNLIQNGLIVPGMLEYIQEQVS